MTNPKKLDSYRGKLSPVEIAAGMNAASANAQRLIEDTELLLAAGRFPSASSLEILSIEESGKVSILHGYPHSKRTLKSSKNGNPTERIHTKTFVGFYQNWYKWERGNWMTCALFLNKMLSIRLSWIN